MFCPACGSKVESGATFCRLCGRQIAPGKPAPVAVSQAKAGTQNVAVGAGNHVPAHVRNHSPAHLVQSLEDRLRRLAGTEKLEGFSLGEMFSEVFKRHTPDELDEYFVTGTAKTTPRIEDVQTGWPKPWFFFRVLVFVVLMYLGFDYMTQEFGNFNAVPGLLFMGCLAVPLTVVVLFFELNVTRDVSFVGVLALFAGGTIVGFIFTEFLSNLLGSSLSWMGHSIAGIVEEAAKLLAVCAIVGRRKHRFILNGVLFGAAVGAGFAVFESMGYAFNSFREAYMTQTTGAILLTVDKMQHFTGSGGTQWFRTDDVMGFLQDVFLHPEKLHADTAALANMIHNIQLRALLSPFGHVAWTAIAAGGLWRVKGGRDLEMWMFFHPLFLRIFMIPVGLHMIWDLNWSAIMRFFGKDAPVWPVYVMYLVLGAIGWFIVMGLVQQGLHQVKDEQIAHTKRELEQVQTAPGVVGVEVAPVVVQ